MNIGIRASRAICFGAALGCFSATTAWAGGAGPERLPAALIDAHFYAWGAVGTPGQVSAEELAARDVAKHWTAQQIRAGLASANAEGRLFLLCVARRNFPDAYAGLKKSAGIRSDDKVSLFSGNVLQRVTAAEVMAQFESSGCEALGWPVGGKAR